MGTTEPPLSVAQAAKRLNQSRSTILTLVRQGRFPNAYKAGSGSKSSPVRIPAADIDHYERTAPLAF
jgi:excisionase family DNA binding protein